MTMSRVRQVSMVCTLAMLLVPSFVGAQAPRPIALKATDSMKFDVTKITAKPGESLRVRLTTVSTMPKAAMAHNFVLLKAGTDVAAFAMAAAMARTTDFIPAKLKASVIASTSLAGAGETVEVIFKAPIKPGTYVFLCSFPGHYNTGMTGTLIVK